MCKAVGQRRGGVGDVARRTRPCLHSASRPEGGGVVDLPRKGSELLTGQ